MQILTNEGAIEVPGEGKLIERFQRAARRHDGKIYSTIAVKNLAGVARILIRTHTQGEDNSVVTLLENGGFNDELVVEVREVDEDGGTEVSIEGETHPEYDCIYSLAEPRVVTTKIPPREDPGPDPSWLEFYKP